jgi:hypothetical protein
MGGAPCYSLRVPLHSEVASRSGSRTVEVSMVLSFFSRERQGHCTSHSETDMPRLADPGELPKQKLPHQAGRGCYILDPLVHAGDYKYSRCTPYRRCM